MRKGVDVIPTIVNIVIGDFNVKDKLILRYGKMKRRRNIYVLPHSAQGKRVKMVVFLAPMRWRVME